MSVFEFAGMTGIGERAQYLSDALFFGRSGWVNEGRRPFASNFGIRGVAVCYINEQPTIVMIVDSSQVSELNTILRADEVGGPKDAMWQVFRETSEQWQDVYAMAFTEPELQVGPGDLAQASGSGTFGAPVRWNNRRGLLTAGHVAGNVGQIVSSGSTTVGSVVASLNPASGQTGADVAVVELLPGISQSGATFNGSTSLTGPGNISILRNSGTIGASVLGMSPWFYFPSVNATYNDVYLTSQAVTQKGDSGTAVTDPANRLVGHVVGASPTCASFIQDARYQLNVIKTLPGFIWISI